MDDKTENALVYVLIIGALAIAYSLLGLVPAALLCRVFGWPFGTVWPYVTAAALSTAFVQLRWYAMTHRDRTEDEPPARGDGKEKALWWEIAAAVILVFFAVVIVYGLLGLILVIVSHFVFGLPVTAGLLALVAGGAACAAAVSLWRTIKAHPDSF